MLECSDTRWGRMRASRTQRCCWRCAREDAQGRQEAAAVTGTAHGPAHAHAAHAGQQPQAHAPDLAGELVQAVWALLHWDAVDLSLKVDHHDWLHLGHLWLEFLWCQVALPVCELVVAEPVV